jgi:hypothetical protein
MSGLLNIFKNLFAGVFGFLGGLLGGKSKGGFYLELKEESGTPPVAKAAPAAKAAPVAKASAAPVAVAAPAASKSAEKVSKAKSTRAEKLAALATKETSGEKAAATAAVATALNLPQPTVTPAPKEPVIKTFADAYLLPLATPSRRPGANMSSFLDMARQVKKA